MQLSKRQLAYLLQQQFNAPTLDQYIRSLGPAAWFRMDQGVTVTGSGVSQWDDQSGNGRHLLQGTDAARPALQGDGTILFNGTSHYLKTNAFTLAQPETIYLVVNQVSWTNADYFFDGNSAVSGVLLQSAASPDLRISAGSVVAVNGGLDVGAFGVVTVQFNGASSSLQINQNAATTGNAGAGNMGGFTLGSRADGAISWSNIAVKECAIFAAAHDATTRARIISGLMARHGLT